MISGDCGELDRRAPAHESDVEPCRRLGRSSTSFSLPGARPLLRGVALALAVPTLLAALIYINKRCKTKSNKKADLSNVTCFFFLPKIALAIGSGCRFGFSLLTKQCSRSRTSLRIEIWPLSNTHSTEPHAVAVSQTRKIGRRRVQH